MQMFRHCILAALAVTTARAQTPSGALRFEVASIRSSAPGIAEQAQIGVHIDGAQVRCSNLSLRDYIDIAWKVKFFQISGPSWLTATKFDISAKIPEGTSAAQVPAMLQSLLEERFGLTLHRETKDFPVYALVVSKGGAKLTEAPPDPAEQKSDFVAVAASGSKDGTTVDLGNGSYLAVANNKLEARKMGFPAFADALARFVDRPVVDLTGLTGAYDFTISVSPEDFLAMTVRSGVSAGVSLPPQALRLLDNGPAESLFSGIEKLGLKLDARKAPLEFYVVDHMERLPTEN
jgi:uncharacterized protein (TIGR03435 family)